MAATHVERLGRVWTEREGIFGWITTTDHKRIGILYLFTALALFVAAGVEALLIRTQLIGPNQDLLSPGAYNEVFTMHGITMIFLFVIPISTGAFGNYLLPLQIGARDMAFPRMNALSYWAYLGSGILIYTGLAMGQAPDAGWFNYVPLADKQFSPNAGIDFYALGIILNSISTQLTAGNFIVTIFKMRAPGMSLNRMPLFCYAFLAVAFAVLFALPLLSTAMVFLELDRRLGMHFYDVAAGGEPLLWQHLFWIFGHPEVYIIILPAFGIATSIIPTFARRRMVAFELVALAEILVAFIGFGVWAHHMFAVGMPIVTTIYFAAASMIIAIPSGIQLFAWITTILTGTPQFKTPLMWILGFIVLFIIGGVSGVMFAAIPFDQQTTDTYFVVAHFHFVIFGAAVFPILGGLHFWFPKVTGRMPREDLGQIAFWLAFTGTMLTFFPMHIVGLDGMPRRTYTYPGGLGWTGPNLIETIGSYILTVGLLTMVANFVWSLRRGAVAGNDPWGATSLEWATTSPPPAYNFPVVPRVTSPYAMWDTQDREADARRLERGEMTLETGHETQTTTTLDANVAEVLEMPSHSPYPVLLAAAMAGVFTMLLTGHWTAALVFGGAMAAVLAAWHGAEPARPRAPRKSISNGMWGMGIFIVSEATLFGTLIATYFYLQARGGAWPPKGIAAPSVTLPLILTGALLLTTVPMVLAERAAQHGRRGATGALVGLATLVQGGYLAWQIVLYLSDLDKFSPSGTAYGSIYFTLLGADHAHVLVGILLNLWVLARLVAGLNGYRVLTVRVVAFYWIFVNLLTVLVTLTQVSPS